MTSSAADPQPIAPPPQTEPGTPLSRRLAALAVTLLFLAAVALQHSGVLSPSQEQQEGGSPPAVNPTPPPPDVALVLQSRVAVTAASILQEQTPSQSRLLDLLTQQMRDSAGSDAVSLLRFAPVAAQLAGNDQARTVLQQALAEAGDDPPSWFVEDAQTFEQLLLEGRVPSQQAQERLLERHGWFAKLALGLAQGPSSPALREALAAARRSLVAFSTLILVLVTALVAGVVALAIALVKMSRGTFVWAYRPAAPGGSVYLETFALFLAAFLILSPLAALAAPLLGRGVSLALWLILPLAAWPRLRGCSAASWRRALGWTRGRSVLREIAAGLVGYCATIPILVLGVATTVLLLLLRSALFPSASERAAHSPSVHPLIQAAEGASPGLILLFLSLTSLWAPLVEETFFRGAYLHHLRSNGKGPILSALITGFVFAALHPTGLLTIPPLMALGFSFAMLRQWRGSIIANATAHSLHNTLVLGTVLWALS